MSCWPVAHLIVALAILSLTVQIVDSASLHSLKAVYSDDEAVLKLKIDNSKLFLEFEFFDLEAQLSFSTFERLTLRFSQLLLFFCYNCNHNGVCGCSLRHVNSYNSIRTF